MKTPFVTAIVPAAGASARMEGLEKLFQEMEGVPVLAYTLKALSSSPWIREIVIVTRKDLISSVLDMIRIFGIEKIKTVVQGGATRQQSVAAGAAEASPEAEYFAIHDGARPFVTEKIIATTILNAMQHGVSAAAVPVTDTVKLADKHGMVAETPPRERLFAMQTPQVLSSQIYREALAFCTKQGLDCTDDCQMAEAAGFPVHLSRGHITNVKITYPSDLQRKAPSDFGRSEL